jgi:hypothetical protein
MPSYVTKPQFDAAARHDPYYHASRWDYYSAAVATLRGLDFGSSLELGPHRLPLVSGGDTMDLNAGIGPTVQHDATTTPWPIEDSSYDLFIALQVWEHLEGRQTEAFAEVMRITRRFALLSFPLMWNSPDNPSHHGITRNRIRDWTLGFKPVSTEVIGAKRARIIYLFNMSDTG